MDVLTRRIKILLLILVSIIGFCILAMTIWLWALDYDTFTTIILEAVDKQSWRPYFQASVLTPSRFHLIRYLLFIILGAWILVSYWVFKNIRPYSHSIARFIQKTTLIRRHHVQQTTKTEKIFLALIFLAFAIRGLWQMHYVELQYDEAWTYNHFISKGFIVSLISPNNNHIFYTLFACITDYLPLEAKYSLRLPAYFGGMATCLLFYAMARSIWDWRWALVALAWFAFSPGVAIYSMYARGYIFQLFFTILVFWTTLKILSNSDNSRYYWTLWVLANILGLYSLPTHTYVLVAINIILLIAILVERLIDWKHWLIANITVFVLTSLLYLPLMLTNGVNVLVDVATTNTPQGEPFWNYQDKVSDWLLIGAGRGTPVYWFWLLFVLVLVVVLILNRKEIKQRKPIGISLFFLLIPSLLNLLTGSQPPFRVWCFLTLFIAIAIPIIGTQIVPKINSNILLIGMIISFISFGLLRVVGLSETGVFKTEIKGHYAMYWSLELDREAKKIAAIMQEKNIDECYFFSNYDKPLLECYYLRAGKSLKPFMISTSSKNYAPFVNSPIYQSVLWDKEDRVATQAEINWLEQYYPIVIYKNKRIEIRKN
jgi:hypothetical protein